MHNYQNRKEAAVSAGRLWSLQLDDHNLSSTRKPFILWIASLTTTEESSLTNSKPLRSWIRLATEICSLHWPPSYSQLCQMSWRVISYQHRQCASTNEMQSNGLIHIFHSNSNRHKHLRSDQSNQRGCLPPHFQLADTKHLRVERKRNADKNMIPNNPRSHGIQERRDKVLLNTILQESALVKLSACQIWGICGIAESR